MCIGKRANPLHRNKPLNRVYVEIGNVCNLSCSFCPGTARPLRQMSATEFAILAAKLRPYTDFLYLHVMGEPLLHPALECILTEAGAQGFRVCMTTNGVLLPTRTELLLKHAATIHKVSVSLHSMEGNGIDAFQGYLASAADFAVCAAERGIYTAFRLWNLDADGKQGANCENAAIEAFLKERFDGEWVPLRNGFRLRKSIFLEYAGIFTWPTESTADEKERGNCHGLIDQLAVLADGTVVPCCLDSEGEIVLGNLFSETMEQILSAPRAVAMREGLHEGRLTEPLCRRCTYARRFQR